MTATQLDRTSLFLLVCREACLDGTLDPDEKKSVGELQRLLAIPAARAKDLFRRARAKAAAARRIGLRPLDPHALFRSACWHAWLDGEVTRDEWKLLLGLSRYLGLDPADAKQLYENARPGALDPPPSPAPAAPTPANESPLIRLARRADGGEGAAMVELGARYLEGDGVPRDEDQAMVWFHRAASAGEAEGWVRLGILYRDGVGLPADPSLALRFFDLAAEAGNARGRELAAALAEAPRTA